MTILFIAPNLVLRLYLDGSGIDRLCGTKPAVSLPMRNNGKG